MSTMQPEVLDECARRELPILDVLPYMLLAIATGLAIGIDHGDGGKLIVDLGASALAAVWMLWFVTLHPAWVERRVLMGVFFTGFVVISAVLVLNDPVYGFFSWTGYIWIYRVLHDNWRIPGLLAVATITGTSQHGGLPGADAGSWISWVAIIALNCFVAGAVAWMTAVRDQQHALRVEAIEELTETNAKLEASMRENAGLHEQLLAGAREAGVLDERQRMAGEIHDTLAQGLVGIITQLEAAAHGGKDARRHADIALELARDSLAEARRSVQALAPAQLDRARLADALAEVAAKWSALTGVAANTTTTGTPMRVRPEIEVALLRTAQEALANVAQHARANTVAITLSYMDDVVSLDVCDDGVGIGGTVAASTGGEAPSSDSGGFGLIAMRQRVEGLGGALAVESDPSRGTTVAANIPVIPAEGDGLGESPPPGPRPPARERISRRGLPVAPPVHADAR